MKANQKSKHYEEVKMNTVTMEKSDVVTVSGEKLENDVGNDLPEIRL